MLNFLSNTFNRYSSVRYLIMGGVNTIIALSFYYLLLKLGVNYLLASAVTYIFGVIEGFLLNSWIVFKKSAELSGLLKYSAVYCTSLGLNLLLMYIWVDLFHISQYIAPILTTIILTVINYVLIKRFIFAKNQYKSG